MSPPGILQDFEMGQHRQVEAVLEDLKRLGTSSLRVKVSWAGCQTPEGAAWHSWLIGRTAQDLEVIPCLVEVPEALGLEPNRASPPRLAEGLADFVGQLVGFAGRHFGWVELWEDPRDLRLWDWRADPGSARFAQMVKLAAARARALGKKVALCGTSPFDPGFLAALHAQGALEQVDAVVVRGFPGADDIVWEGYGKLVERARQLLRELASPAALWLHAGYCSWRHDEHRQLEELLGALSTDADRVFWRGARDLTAKDRNFGLRREDGSSRLLHRLWLQQGLQGLPAMKALTAPSPAASRGAKGKHAVVFGGAGFVGSNLVDALCAEGRKVVVFDSLARAGVERNLAWLRERHGGRLGVVVGDVRDAQAVREVVNGAAEVFHFAAQVAVTTSLSDPVHDFEVNARGTLNVLEAARAQKKPPALLFSSTNKVYGGMEDLALKRVGERYQPESRALRTFGIPEERGLDFESPYGCSKGAADQYVLDYSRSFGLRAVVFRMSCIYGPRQFGNEDQGWVAHFLIRALEGEAITVYGDGRQVRDILYVGDLVQAMRLAMAQIAQLGGRAYNLGGGPLRTVSLLELLSLIERLTGQAPKLRFAGWRQGDQRYYVSDTRRFEQASGWRPEVSVEEGVASLYAWLTDLLGVGRAPLVAAEAHGAQAR